MKRLILSRLWMLIGIIIITTGQIVAQTPPPNIAEGFYLD